jgi:hypothetical protein
MMAAIRVLEAPLAESGDRAPLRLRDVRAAVARGGIPHVDVLGRDVQVAAEHERAARVARRREPRREALVPGELRLVEREPTTRPFGA